VSKLVLPKGAYKGHAGGDALGGGTDSGVAPWEVRSTVVLSYPAVVLSCPTVVLSSTNLHDIDTPSRFHQCMLQEEPTSSELAAHTALSFALMFHNFAPVAF
jgi:hypothetical protein